MAGFLAGRWFPNQPALAFKGGRFIVPGSSEPSSPPVLQPPFEIDDVEGLKSALANKADVATAAATTAETVVLVAGGTVQARRVVRSSGGVAMPVDTAQLEHASEVVGVSVGSATAGQQVVVQRFGIAAETLWSWTGGTLYCGPQGELTPTPAPTGWLLQVARVLSPTQVDIDIEEPTLR